MNRFMVLLLSLMVTSVFTHANSEHSLGTQADSMKSSGKTYHQSSSMIRKMHPEFMNHKRDKTLRQGVRTEEYSLKGCVSCHASKKDQSNDYHAIDASEQFCSTCHKKVAISVDCFGCHRTTPAEGDK
ncbi:sulfur reduction protein DsrJ [Candidatus Thioglobus sp.]|nr:sulfur reduction protein DsrJ [Candidatus Thioglobus sp.]MDB3892648.1 sulfur reduction protein DsrJ [Candidatus Thioglobus sp.]MDB9829008.1 sulfur reduction protein DsrJ [Candidatus Thioglobus sp.]MDC0920229.1 sulfur reduction protein DsrJ [Candidatus Thioglobus sp.]MDC0965367.1 sulfur reduction protein DsrJ [Candidatus Thioglobus sp.]